MIGAVMLLNRFRRRSRPELKDWVGAHLSGPISVQAAIAGMSLERLVEAGGMMELQAARLRVEAAQMLLRDAEADLARVSAPVDLSLLPPGQRGASSAPPGAA